MIFSPKKRGPADRAAGPDPGRFAKRSQSWDGRDGVACLAYVLSDRSCESRPRRFLRNEANAPKTAAGSQSQMTCGESTSDFQHGDRERTTRSGPGMIRPPGAVRTSIARREPGLFAKRTLMPLCGTLTDENGAPMCSVMRQATTVGQGRFGFGVRRPETNLAPTSLALRPVPRSPVSTPRKLLRCPEVVPPSGPWGVDHDGDPLRTLRRNRRA